jgi:Holliday junction DNA helicase RuvA subunit
VIREAMRRLTLTDADKAEILMVGDRKFDVLGAKECGIDCVGVELFGYAEPNELHDAGAVAVVKSAEELESFQLLITVSGVGPKAAISILSQLTPSRLVAAICADDKKAIAAANGIGPKTAARIILELKDKVTKGGGSESTALFPTASNPAVDEATTALVMLGFTKPNVNKAISAVLKESPSATLEEIIKLALKRL